MWWPGYDKDNNQVAVEHDDEGEDERHHHHEEEVEELHQGGVEGPNGGALFVLRHQRMTAEVEEETLKMIFCQDKVSVVWSDLGERTERSQQPGNHQHLSGFLWVRAVGNGRDNCRQSVRSETFLESSENKRGGYLVCSLFEINIIYTYRSSDITIKMKPEA